MSYKLLIVDDELPNLRLLQRLFAPDFECFTASSGAEALQLLKQHDVAILISDQRMPEMTGMELLNKTASLRPHMVRILLTGYTDVETLVEAVNSGLVYKYVTKPWNNDNLKVTIQRARQHYEINKKSHLLELANHRMLARIKAITRTIAASLADMLKARDPLSYARALGVRQYAMAIGTAMKLSAEQQKELSDAALLHDLGSSNTRVKPGGVSNFSSTPTSVQAACEASLLFNVPELASLAAIVNSLAENFDGSGLPFGLAGNYIPLASRIIRVAREYDLLVKPLIGDAPMTPDAAIRSLMQGVPQQLDPNVLQILGQLPAGKLAEWRHQNALTSEHNPLGENSFEPSFFDTVIC